MATRSRHSCGQGSRHIPTLISSQTSTTFAGLRAGSTLSPLITLYATTIQPNEEHSIATSPSTTSRVQYNPISRTAHNHHSTSELSINRSRSPWKLWGIYAMVFWTIREGKDVSLTGLPYPALVDERIPSSLKFSTDSSYDSVSTSDSSFYFWICPCSTVPIDLVEPMILIQYTNHQLSTLSAFPWFLESYFAFRMNQYTRTEADYKVPFQNTQLSPPEYTSHSLFVVTRSHYHPTTVPRSSQDLHNVPTWSIL